LAAFWLSGAQLASAACLYGSLTDCNPAGTTLNPAAAFVDANPPAGFVQCAGFRNTASDDVRWDWENDCAVQMNGVLFVRVFDDASGALIAGARLFQSVEGCFPPQGRTYRTDRQEGEGLLDNPGLSCGSGALRLGWHTTNQVVCFCGRPGGGLGVCDDIYAANAANDKIFYVGASSSAHSYEGVWGPPGPIGSCTLTAPLTALRVAIYVPDPKCGDGVLDAGNACDDGNLISGDGCDRDCRIEPCYQCAGQPSSCEILNGTSCDDGLFCNGPDSCSIGGCTTHTGDPCAGGTECNNLCNENADHCAAPSGLPCTDDGNVCTNDQCDGVGACIHRNSFDSCDDGLFCNGTDGCRNGSCSFHLGNPCSAVVCNDRCDEAGARCLASASGTECPEDGFECTSDECNGTGECAHLPIPGCATYTPTPTLTPLPSETATSSPTITRTLMNTATPTPEPAPGSLKVRRVRLQANVGRRPGVPNGAASVGGLVDANPPFDGFEQEISATGVSLRIAGGGGVEMTHSWPPSSCVIAPSTLGLRVTCDVTDAGGRRNLTLRPTSSPNVYRLRFVTNHLNIPLPRSSAPVRVVLSTALFARQDDIYPCAVAGKQSQVSLCREAGVVPTPTPAPPLGERVFSVARPGSALLSSIVGGVDVSAEPWLPAMLRLRAGVVDVDGLAPLELLEDAIVGLKIVDGSTLCMKIYATGSHGHIDCDGGTPFDILSTYESNGPEPSGAFTIHQGLGSDAGPGAGTLFAHWNAQLLGSFSTVASCQRISYSMSTFFDSFTTALSTGTILDPVQGGTVTISAQGQNFSCATWTEENAEGRLLTPILANGFVAADVANMLVIADAPSTQPPQAPTPTPSATP